MTHVSLVSTQLQRLLAYEKNHALLRSLKVYFAWGKRHPSSAYRTILNLGLNIYLSYGLTEMSSQVATGKVIEGPSVLCQSFALSAVKHFF